MTTLLELLMLPSAVACIVMVIVVVRQCKYHEW